MAILAPPDWQYSPRDPAMDKGPSPPASSSTPPAQQRPHQLPMPQPPLHPQQYPFQQQPQGSWTPSLAAPPFYPGAFYQNPQQPPQQYAVGPPANPYFDPANAQLAQWAYQQMMFNAQQHGQQVDFFAPPPGMHGQFNPFPSGTPPPRPSDAPQPQYPGPAAPGGGGYHPYRRPSRQQSGHSDSAPQQDWARTPQPPYSRPDASASSSSVNSQGRPRTNSNNSQGRGSAHSHSPVPSTKGPSPQPSSSAPPPPRIPHNRAASSSSTHSAHSTSSASPSPPASASAPGRPRPSPLSASTLPSTRSPLSSSSLNPASSAGRAERRISRDDSSLALSSLSLLATRAEAATTSSSATNAKVDAKAAKGSSGLKGLGRLRRALSFNASVALKEEVGDDGEGAEDDLGGEDGGRAAGSDSDESIKASVVNPSGKAKTPALIASATRKPGSAPASALSPAPSSLPPPSQSQSSSPSSSSPFTSAGVSVPMPKKKSRAASLFNSRMNVSTDNISLSSTVSSASVMIRKLGSMGRLARRNSLAGITGLFKERKKKNSGAVEGEGDEEQGKGKDKDKDKAKDKSKSARNAKSQASEASVSHATAELEAGDVDWSVPTNSNSNAYPDTGVKGLSPAAKLARQHTLKSNAEAAAKAREAAARAASSSPSSSPASGTGNANGAPTNGMGVNGGAGGVPTWERNTATRSPGRQQRGGAVGVGEDGTHAGVLVEDSESEDEPHSNAYSNAHPHPNAQGGQGAAPGQAPGQQGGGGGAQWDDDDDEEWGLLGGEEDDTIRVAVDPTGAASSSSAGYGHYGDGDGDGDGEGEDGYGYDGEGGYGYGGEGGEGGYGYEGEGEHEPWAVDVRRSVERTRAPAKGILKYAGTYDQTLYLADAHGHLFGPGNQAAHLLRARSNSYTSPTPGQNELGPLARMPSPDPDHIDGLHRHGSYSSAHGGEPSNSGGAGSGAAGSGGKVDTGTGAGKRSSVPSLPPLGFDLGLGGVPPPHPPVRTRGDTHDAHPHHDRRTRHLQPPALNSSAPALTTSFAPGPTMPAVPRAATAPVRKQLAFASNLSVYDTFSASMYDRRSEPATWSRLTPALAQRIKEELNSYKMEEMEHPILRLSPQLLVYLWSRFFGFAYLIPLSPRPPTSQPTTHEDPVTPPPST
ncbi:hypothetical protein B0H12DRAFT_1242066 [Mycena haematopus]|nr:hypothetical protein B0H12DRAFT_1242066 [Mycena haematopus]